MIVRPALIALLALAATPAAAGAVPWSAPRSVTVSGLAREPAVALGGPDAAAISYVRHLSGADRVELRRGTVARLGTPTILDRDARHGFDSPTLTYSGHDALLVWRRFRDANTRVLELASVTRAGRVGGPRAITGPPNTFSPAFADPGLLTFWRRTAAYTIAIADRTAGAKTRLPAGAAFESVVAALPDGTLMAAWPSAGAIFAATREPGATAFGAPVRLSAPGGFARSPQLAFTPDGHTVAVWTQSDGTGRALVSAARPPGGAFGAPTTVLPSSHQVLTVHALGSSAGDVLVAFVSARAEIASGPLRALRLGPNGQASSPVRTLTPPGERTRDVSLAADSSAGYATWVTGGVTSRHAVRVVRIAGSIVGTVRTVSGSDGAVAARPAFAMSPRGRALIAYATTSGRIRLVTRRAG
ncbi:MAG TPA: hypothetical protein VF087_06395 [Solirubrobacteraceae bacterium]